MSNARPSAYNYVHYWPCRLDRYSVTSGTMKTVYVDDTITFPRIIMTANLRFA